MVNKNLLLQLGIARLGFLSCEEKIKLQNNLDNIANLAILSIDDISFMVNRVVNTRDWPVKDFEKLVLKDYSIMESYHIGFFTCEDEKYPVMLKQVFDPPYGLFYRGNPEILNTPSVAIVGTRHATRTGLNAANEFGKGLVDAGYTVVSGMAMGIDGAAHNGAFPKTVAVLACGLDILYPGVNKKLGGRIIQSGGCIISEYSPGEPPVKWRFPQRNRIISGLSEATVVIEAPPKSGALITADFALEQDRALFFHNCAVDYHKRYMEWAKKNQVAVPSKCRNVEDYIQEGAPCISNVNEFMAKMFEK